MWFVGIEEGLGDTGQEELEERFRAADGKITIDIRPDFRRDDENIVRVDR